MNTYVVIDVEMCGVQIRTQNYNRRHEIVQIGAVMMNDTYEIIDSFSTFVRPDYGKIDYFISSLTGIANKDVKNAPGLSDALRSMMEWFGDRNIRFYAWSNTDYNQIRGEILDKKLDEEAFEVFLDRENWVDYQNIVNVRFKIGRSLALSDALQMTELMQKAARDLQASWSSITLICAGSPEQAQNQALILGQQWARRLAGE